jgi:protein TonB
MSYVETKDSGRRLTGFVVVVAFHMVVIYALVHGLARKIVEVVRQPLETKIIEEIKPPPPDKPPPPPPPRLAAPPPPYIPPPEVRVQVPVNAPTITAVTTTKPVEPVPPPSRPPVAAAPPAPPRAPVRTAPVVDAKACEKPPYPPQSLRARETGVVQLSFLIDVDGNVLESQVAHSSGHRRLDEAAKSGLSLCKFRPGTLDGKPERSWARIEYEWKIE